MPTQNSKQINGQLNWWDRSNRRKSGDFISKFHAVNILFDLHRVHICLRVQTMFKTHMITLSTPHIQGRKWHFNGDPRWHLLCAVTSAVREWSITLGCFHLCQSLTEERSYTKATLCYSRAAGWGDYGITQLFHYCGCGPARFNRWNILLISQQQTGAFSPAAAHGGTVRYVWKQLRGHGFCPVPSQHGFGPNPLNKQLWSQLAELSNGICLKCERVQFPTCQLWKMNFHMLHICH